MASQEGFIIVAASNNDTLSNASVGDLLIYTSTSNQNILLGASNQTSLVTLNMSNVVVSKDLNVTGNLNFTGTLKQNGAPYIGSQWSNSSSNVFLLSSNVGIGKSNPSVALDVVGSAAISSNLTVAGNLTVSGSTTTISTQSLLVTDNIIQVNKDQVGAPLSSLVSGIEVNRGADSNYYFVFEEATDLFKIGVSNNLQAVTTRDDVLNAGYPYYDATSKKLTNRSLVASDITDLSTITDPLSNAAYWTSNNIRLGWSNNSSNIFTLSNIGIGKSNPEYTLDVVGSINFTGSLTSNGQPFVSGGGSGSAAGWSNIGSNIVTYCNVGIGLSNPEAALHVSSNLRVDGSLNIANCLSLPGISLSMTGTTANTTAVYAYTSNIVGFSNLVWGSSNGVQFAVPSQNATDVFRFVNSGTTSNELMRLQGNGTVTFAGNVAMSNAVQFNGFEITQRSSPLINNLTTSTPYTVGATGATFAVASNNSNTYFKFQGNTTEVARLTGDGKLGIGTSNPAYTLDVIGGVNFEGFLAVNKSSSNNGDGTFQGNVSASNIQTNATTRITYAGAIINSTADAGLITTGTIATARLPTASTTVSGIVQLSDSTSTTNSTIAATSTAVRTAYNLANTANTTANTANTNASTALTTANTANTTANTANTNASTALTTANNALPKSGGSLTGWFGINVTPSFPLHIVNSVTSGNGAAVYSMSGGYYYNQTGASSQSPSSRPICSKMTGGDLWVEGGYGLMTNSDRRLKKDFASLEPALSKSIINSLKTVQFQFIDQANNRGPMVGWIAQDIEEVCPMAVSMQKSFLPNIYTLLTVSSQDNETITLIANKENIPTGQRCRLVTPDGINHDCQVLESNTTIFKMRKPETFLYETNEQNEVFVYGTEVDDVRLLDKDTIFTHAMVVIQEQQKQIDNLVKDLSILKEQLHALTKI